MLYLVCENELKIPLGTCFIEMQVETVQTGGRAKGGQRGPHKRPWWQVKTVPEVKKIGAKSILGLNWFRKVEGEIFLFSACPLIYIHNH